MGKRGETTRLGLIHNAFPLSAGVVGATSSKLGVSPAICHIGEITLRGRQDNKLFGTRVG